MNPGQVKIDPSLVRSSKMILCDCGGAMFTPKMMLKKISPIVSPTGKEEVFPLNILVCDACGLVPNELNPENMIPKEYLAVKKKNK